MHTRSIRDPFRWIRMRQALRIALGFLVIVLFLAVGEGIVRLFGAPIPGSVLGMVLLAAALRGPLPSRVVAPAAELLLRYMALFFIPPGVALMGLGERMEGEWTAALIASVVSLLVVMVVVGLVQQRLEPGD